MIHHHPQTSAPVRSSYHATLRQERLARPSRASPATGRYEYRPRAGRRCVRSMRATQFSKNEHPQFVVNTGLAGEAAVSRRPSRFARADSPRVRKLSSRTLGERSSSGAPSPLRSLPLDARTNGAA
jgi:hypothetical protein